ncbi:TPA: hypothetical protein QFT34_000563 [Enterococcus faecium]|nr:hypothetical protein [Enterococcus lactis]MDE3905413.1 hypothetical protein [Enterococcus lactis]
MENTSNVLKGLVEIPNNYELVNELIEQRNKKKVNIIRYQIKESIFIMDQESLKS